MKKGPPSLYVGESSRSIQERAKEHWGAARRREEDSHMRKHQDMVHPGEPPAFLFKLISNHKTPLSRQIREAVRIRRRGGASAILNSRSEFNRCHIPRLVVEEEEEGARQERRYREQLEKDELCKEMEEMTASWEEQKTRKLELEERKRRRPSEMEDGLRKKDGRRRTKRM